MHYQIDPTDEQVAAAMTAVRCYIQQQALGGPAERSNGAEPPARSWNTAAAMAAQGMPPARGGAYRTWGAAERSARAGRWSYGITGL